MSLDQTDREQGKIIKPSSFQKGKIDNAIDEGVRRVSEIIESSLKGFNERTSPEDKREDTRGRVTSRIIWMYVACVVVIILTGAIKIFFATPDTVKVIVESLRILVDFLNVLVLPIITLVLGFYFGSEKR